MLGFQPFQPLIIGTIQAKAFDMLVARNGNLVKGSSEFDQREIEGIILDVFASTLDGLEKNVDLSEITVQGLVLTWLRVRLDAGSTG